MLEELGAEVIPSGASPNGTNINDGCGALHPEAVAKLVRRYRADVGIALGNALSKALHTELQVGEHVTPPELQCFVEDQRRAVLAAALGDKPDELGVGRR